MTQLQTEPPKVDPLEVVRRLATDFELYCRTVLLVEDKQTGTPVPFVWKPVQRRLAEAILERWSRGAPVRIVVLKARREGVSTLVQAFLFWVTTTRENRRAFTVAHDEDTTKYLHGMAERYYEQMPPPIRPMRRESRKGQVLEFANKSRDPDQQRLNPGLNSSLATVSQKNAGAGKGATLLHLSEVALWPKESAKKTLDTMLQIVPRAGMTAVIFESTARGIGNEFHRRWRMAEQGLSDYEAFFIPWFDEPTNRVTPPAGFEVIDYNHPTYENEADLVERYSLDEAQLFWRRLTIENECGGDLETFHQEYPATPEEAFLSTGRPYFNQQALRRHVRAALDTEVWRRGKLYEEKRDGVPWVLFAPDRRGELQIWEAPQEHEDYLISCDASEGSEGDFQAVYVFPRSKLEIVAAWHGRVDRDQLGDVLYRLGRLYNTAKVAVEITGGWGLVPLHHLKMRGYTRLYYRPTVGKRREKRRDAVGWDTTVQTRPLALDALGKALRQDAIKVNDRHLLEECATFVYGDDGKPGAEVGCHDDRVLAASLGVYLWTTEPRRHWDETQPVRQPLSAVSGY